MKFQKEIILFIFLLTTPPTFADEEDELCVKFANIVQQMNEQQSAEFPLGTIYSAVDCESKTFKITWTTTGHELPPTRQYQIYANQLEYTVCDPKREWNKSFSKGWKVTSRVETIDGSQNIESEINKCWNY